MSCFKKEFYFLQIVNLHKNESVILSLKINFLCIPYAFQKLLEEKKTILYNGALLKYQEPSHISLKNKILTERDSMKFKKKLEQLG